MNNRTVEDTELQRRKHAAGLGITYLANRWPALKLFFLNATEVENLRARLFSSLRIRLLFIVLFALLPALGMILHTTSKQRELARQNALEESLRLVRAISTQQEEVIEAGRQLLISLSEVPSVREQASAACGDLFSALLKNSKRFVTLLAAKPNGDVFCISNPEARLANLSDRPYFRQVLKTRKFTTSEFIIGRFTNKPIITLSYPALDREDNLRAVVIIGMDLSWVNQTIAEARLPRGSNVTVTDRKGVILARYPDPENLIGKSTPEASIVKAVQAENEGTTEAPGLDGVVRLYAFTSLRGVPESGGVYVLASIPKTVAFAAVNRMFAMNLTGLAVVALLVFALAWTGSDILILRKINTLVNATRRIAAGELGARAGISHNEGEIGQLAQSFDEMADALEKRQTEGERAEKQILRQLKELAAVQEIGQAIASNLDLQAVLKILMQKIDEFLPYSAVLVWLLNRETGMVERAACWNLDEKDWKGRNLEGAPPLVKEAIEGQIPVVVSNLQTDPRTFDRDFYRSTGLISYLGVPLIVKGEVLGDLVFLTREEHRFGKDEIDFLSTVASEAAIAIQNSQLYERIKNQAAELQKANHLKLQFLSVMSHELRTPLSSIMGYTALLRDGIQGKVNETQKRDLDKVLGRSGELLDMINGILRATALESGEVTIERVEVNARDFLDGFRSLYNLPLEKDLDLIWDYPASLPIMKTDTGKLANILQDLIRNAVKFTDGGTITVLARHIPESEALEFKISDTGIGIPNESLPIIFDMFRQVDSSETRLYGGVGLGLYIVKRYTELLGGNIAVESEVGKGSTFTVRIPCKL